MGRADIEIAIRGPRAEELLRDASILKLRLSASNPYSYNVSMPRSEDAVHMDLELRQAASMCCDLGDFVGVLDKVSTEKQLTVAETITSLSPVKNTLVHIAALSCNIEVLAYLLEMYPPIVLERNLRGDTALHAAAKSGFDIGILHILDPFRFPEAALLAELLRVKNGEGNTALHEAFLNGHPEVGIQMFRKDPQLSFYLNDEGKSPFYLAAEAGLFYFFGLMLRHKGGATPDEMLKGKSPLLAAVTSAATTKGTDVLETMLEEEPRFINSRDEEGRTLLHCAAYLGYLQGVRFLVGKYAENAYRWDNFGLFPIHVASMKGHVDVIKELFGHCPDPGEMLTENTQNVLHVACWSGRHNVVKYILESSRLGQLINQRDKDGNTPLHLATLHWHPHAVNLLTWDDRVNLRLTNNHGLTAMDSVLSRLEHSCSYRKLLTWVALRNVKAPQTRREILPNAKNEGHNLEKSFDIGVYKGRVDTLLLVSALAATVTFAAGFTPPGGYNGSDPNQGMATFVRHRAFQVFIICDTLAMYGSIVAMIALFWAQLGDPFLYCGGIRVAVLFLGLALVTMSLAFMAGTYLVVSIQNWLSWCLLFVGFVFVVIISLLFFLSSVPVSSRWKIIRHFIHNYDKLLMLATGSYNTADRIAA